MQGLDNLEVICIRQGDRLKGRPLDGDVLVNVATVLALLSDLLQRAADTHPPGEFDARVVSARVAVEAMRQCLHCAGTSSSLEEQVRKLTDAQRNGARAVRVLRIGQPPTYWQA